MKKILLLTDYSDTSRNAIRYALQIYKNFDCEFMVLNGFVGVPEASNYLDAQLVQTYKVQIDEYVEDLKQVQTNAQHSFEGKSVEGNLFIAISELHNRSPFDLVVVGATGSGKSVRLGSVATEIIRTAPCEVLVVPSSAIPKRIENIVIATDYSNFQSVGVFEHLKEIMEEGFTKLTFLSILGHEDSVGELSADGQADLNDYFAGFDPLHYYIKDTSPVEGIEEYLSIHSTDLMTTVSHNRSLWDVILNRSTSRILAYQAEVPLLVLFENKNEAESNSSSSEWNIV